VVELDPVSLSFLLDGAPRRYSNVTLLWEGDTLRVHGSPDVDGGYFSLGDVVVRVAPYRQPGTYSIPAKDYTTFGSYDDGDLWEPDFHTVNGGGGQLVVLTRRCRDAYDRGAILAPPTEPALCQFKGTFSFTAFRDAERVEITDGQFVANTYRYQP
jgi:hypothetical protein